MTNPTPSPTPAAGEMAQQLSALMEARRALRALYLEVPEAVARDVTAHVEAAFASLRRPAPEPERAGADAMREALEDMLSGWRYLRARYGDLDGVAWDRCESAAAAALAREVPRG
jgi:hypothetical protein